MSADDDVLYEAIDRIAVIRPGRPDCLNASAAVAGHDLKSASATVASSELQQSFKNADFREGVDHHIKKRAPLFKGR